ncbi:MAG: permease [Spirochaetes bacterium]|nr:permease [Spirochaetota bacterium]
MISFIKKFKWDFSAITAFIIFITYSQIMNFQPGIQSLTNFREFFVEMMTIIPMMFILISLFDVWVHREKIQKHIGQNSGMRGIFWVILLAMLQAGPLYGAFPVSYLLWKKGASIRNIFIYLGAFCTMKLPMMFFEISFLGIKFSFLRTLFTLPIVIISGYIIEALLKNRNFKMSSPETAKEK